MSTLAPVRALPLETSEAHVRIAHQNYSRSNPELVSELLVTPSEVSFTMWVPALGEALTYRASLLGGVA